MIINNIISNSCGSNKNAYSLFNSLFKQKIVYINIVLLIRYHVVRKKIKMVIFVHLQLMFVL